MNRNLGDICHHKLFGDGIILEVFHDVAIVKYKKFGLRKISLDQLTKPEKV